MNNNKDYSIILWWLYSHVHGMLFPENLNVMYKKKQYYYNKQEKT